jgi:HD superfamily phosphohydrolase
MDSEVIPPNVIRDPLYGYIDITGVRNIINLPVFQRLRRIHQLSFAYMVYPDATHTRFSHSLGAMELAKRARKYLKLTGQDRKAIKYAALLHDIGHLPFSHAFEVPYAHFVENKKSITEAHLAHIRIGKRIILDGNFKIINIIGKEMAEKVCNLIDPENTSEDPILRQIITGDFSVDRLDYLRRDAYHCGTIEYGTVDAERILFSLTKDPEDPFLPVYREKAKYALEQAILAYFNMYRAVYYHRTVRAAYLLFQDILWCAFEKGIFKDEDKDIKWEDPEFWNRFDDYKCFQMLNASAKADEELRKKLDFLSRRKLPKMVPYEGLRPKNKERLFLICQNSPEEKVKTEREIFEELKNKGYNLNLLLIDSPRLIPYPIGPPYPYLLPSKGNSYSLDMRAPYLRELKRAWEYEEARVYIISKDKNLHTNDKFIEDLNMAIREVIQH